MAKITVIEVDQWTSTGNISEQDFDTVGLYDIEGGDSSAAKAIFGGRFKRKEVEEASKPIMGYVWYVKGQDGKCKQYKANFDTSG